MELPEYHPIWGFMRVPKKAVKAFEGSHESLHKTRLEGRKHDERMPVSEDAVAALMAKEDTHRLKMWKRRQAEVVKPVAERATGPVVRRPAPPPPKPDNRRKHLSDTPHVPPAAVAAIRRAEKTGAAEDREFVRRVAVVSKFVDDAETSEGHQAGVDAIARGEIPETYFDSATGELRYSMYGRTLGTRGNTPDASETGPEPKSKRREGLRFKPGHDGPAWDGTVYEPTWAHIHCGETRFEDGSDEQDAEAWEIDRRRAGVVEAAVEAGLDDQHAEVLAAAFRDNWTLEEIGRQIGGKKGKSQATEAGGAAVRAAVNAAYELMAKIAAPKKIQKK